MEILRLPPDTSASFISERYTVVFRSFNAKASLRFRSFVHLRSSNIPKGNRTFALRYPRPKTTDSSLIFALWLFCKLNFISPVLRYSELIEMLFANRRSIAMGGTERSTLYLRGSLPLRRPGPLTAPAAQRPAP